MAVTVVPHSLPTLDPPSPLSPVAAPPPPAPVSLPAGGAIVPVSATLAANEAMARRRQAGEPVLPLAFGEAGLPVPPALRDALSAVTGGNDYGPVAGRPELRAAAAGYWTRRGLPTAPDAVVSGPGSKPLLFGLMLALGSGMATSAPRASSRPNNSGLLPGPDTTASGAVGRPRRVQ